LNRFSFNILRIKALSAMLERKGILTQVVGLIILLNAFPLLLHAQLRSVPLNPTELKKVEQYKQQVNKYVLLKNDYEQAKYLNLLGSTYWSNNSSKEAAEYFQQSIKINEKIGNKNGIKTLNNYLGIIYSEANEYSSAIEYFKTCLKIDRANVKRAEIAYDLVNIGVTLQNLKDYAESNKVLEEAKDITTELNDLKSLKSCYGMLAENYEKLGNSAKSLEYSGLFNTLQKHFQQQELDLADQKTKTAEAEKMAKESQLQSTYDTLNQVMQVSRERQMQINLLNKEKELQQLAIKEKETRLKNERLVARSLMGGLALLVIILVLIFIQFRNKHKANLLLAAKNLEISLQKQKIDDSIHYANRIQTAVLIPRPEAIHNLPEHFIFFKPREVVSGDFFWISDKGTKILLAAVDCTGHGVPGAFMSMLAISFLNQIVSQIPETTETILASDILNQLREQVIRSLHQTGVRKESKDGMDISLIIWDTKSNKMQYAGAHNSLYHIRKDNLTAYEADRMPISIHRLSDRPFTNRELKLEPNDLIYMFTDGYYDQAGGNDGRKFLSRNFKELLLSNHHLPMQEQRDKLDKAIGKWKGNIPQRDDMLVVGLRFEAKS
jgi:serine phosphatase RsbU (regulator of sigma subunit)